jgi:hypothetical protein
MNEKTAQKFAEEIESIARRMCKTAEYEEEHGELFAANDLRYYAGLLAMRLAKIRD